MTPLVGLSLIVFTGAFTGTPLCQAGTTKTPGVYHHAIVDKVSSLDPHKTADIYSTLAQSLAYESLFEYEFNSKPLKLKPALAKAVIPKSKLSQLVWRIDLKTDVVFQDDPCFVENHKKGRLMTAQDVVYSLERVAAKETMSPSYSHIDGTIKGARDFHDGRSNHISGLKTRGPHTIEIQFEKPSPRFVYWLATSHFAIMAKECVDYYKDDLNLHAIGTGPFRITKFSPTNIVAERNTQFRPEFFKGNKLPLLRRIEIETIKEEHPRWLKFMAGQLEGIKMPASFVPVFITKNGAINSELTQKGVQHMAGVRSDVTYMIWNLRQAPATASVWSRLPKLRQALASAINFKKLIDIAYGGAAIRAYSILAPNLVDYVASENTFHQDQIKNLLNEAGFPNGENLPPLRYIDGNSSLNRNISESLIQDFKKIGVTLDPLLLSWPDLNQKLQQGDFDLTFYGWTSDFPDASNHLEIFHSKAIPPNGVNFGNFNDPKYDALVDQIGTMPEGAKRKKLIKAALKRLEIAQAIIPIAHRLGHQLYQPWVVNGSFVDDTLTGSFFKYRDIQRTPQ